MKPTQIIEMIENSNDSPLVCSTKWEQSSESMRSMVVFSRLRNIVRTVGTDYWGAETEKKYLDF